MAAGWRAKSHLRRVLLLPTHKTLGANRNGSTPATLPFGAVQPAAFEISCTFAPVLSERATRAIRASGARPAFFRTAVRRSLDWGSTRRESVPRKFVPRREIPRRESTRRAGPPGEWRRFLRGWAGNTSVRRQPVRRFFDWLNGPPAGRMFGGDGWQKKLLVRPFEKGRQKSAVSARGRGHGFQANAGRRG
jgi:hypothetical protein